MKVVITAVLPERMRGYFQEVPFHRVISGRAPGCLLSPTAQASLPVAAATPSSRLPVPGSGLLWGTRQRRSSTGSHGWTLLFPGSHPYAGGPDHYAAYLASTDGFEVELVASRLPPG